MLLPCAYICPYGRERPLGPDPPSRAFYIYIDPPTRMSVPPSQCEHVAYVICTLDIRLSDVTNISYATHDYWLYVYCLPVKEITCFTDSAHEQRKALQMCGDLRSKGTSEEMSSVVSRHADTQQGASSWVIRTNEENQARPVLEFISICQAVAIAYYLCFLADCVHHILINLQVQSITATMSWRIHWASDVAWSSWRGTPTDSSI